ncbi:DNA cytosine methyltransferase [Clostridium gasigenes]|nr:DNA cytosine methyltransferase [Clostridium gasigenes]NKF07322.1 DNA cytosine methyltransferase [Clostridium gasigenes]QSW18295.1 DNA cytosine methyltransferase [Clostridium gasigenes]
MCKYKLVDLFAGAGGLSYGFLQTGRFKVEMAVEINESAQNTYRKNHDNEKVEIKGNILNVDFADVKKIYGDIDFVIGGPPCQGFSNANRQKSTLISNNNKLVKEYIRAIEDLSPRGFILENVKTMDSDKHKFYLAKGEEKDSIIDALEKKEEHVQVATNSYIIKENKDIIYNFYNNRLDISLYLIEYEILIFIKNIAKAKDINKYMDKNKKSWKLSIIEWNKYHCEYFSEKYKNIFSRLFYGLEQKDWDEVRILSAEVLNVQNVLYKLKEVIDNNIVVSNFDLDGDAVIFELISYNIFKYVKSKLVSLGYKVDNYILNAADYGVAQQRNRLIIIGIKNELLNGRDIEEPKKIYTQEKYMKIGDAIKDLEGYKYSFKVNEYSRLKRVENIEYGILNGYLADSRIIPNMVITETTKVAMERFKALKPGENFHSLADSLKTTYTEPSRTQSSVYKRLDYNTTCGTVTNVRKAMWIHPEKNRALSVREAARLQSFPDSFEFLGTKDQQYQQIGNAVPPMLARVIAETVLSLIGDEPEEWLKDKLHKKTEN